MDLAQHQNIKTAYLFEPLDYKFVGTKSVFGRYLPTRYLPYPISVYFCYKSLLCAALQKIKDLRTTAFDTDSPTVKNNTRFAQDYRKLGFTNEKDPTLDFMATPPGGGDNSLFPYICTNSVILRFYLFTKHAVT